MTVYGWDASNHDWGRGPMDLTAARRDGIALFTHKCGEGDHGYEDQFFGRAMDRARLAGFPVVGSYFVNHGGDQVVQANWWFELVQAKAPWWRSHPCFIWQLDAEWFPYMDRKPTVAECNAICARITALGVPAERIIGYLPGWLYTSGEIAAFRYKWWESDYSDNPITPYRNAYPGDASPRWASYGKTPTLLQFGSRTTIGWQPTCDANAARVASEAELQRLFGGFPPRDEEQMIIIQRKTGGAIAVLDATGKRHIGPTEWGGYRAVQAVAAGAVSFAPLEDAAYDAIRDMPAPPTADQIADAVMAHLGTGTPGGLSKQDVLDALTEVLTTLHFEVGGA